METMKIINKAAKITLILVIGLILVGAIVRSSGAGMGCPDWPTCFGQWIPPTSVDQLPSNYQEIYKDHGYGTMPFNATKTWTEYVNRLLGVLIGISILITWILTLIHSKKNPKINLNATLILILVIFQGWLGAYVVKSNLTPIIITAHMVIALLITLLLVLLIAQSTDKTQLRQKTKGERALLRILLIALSVQLILGTQVREQIDQIMNYGIEFPRSAWIPSLNVAFPIHRSFSIVLLLLSTLLIRKRIQIQSIKEKGYPLIICLTLTILTGISMAYAGIPAYIQPLHLLFSTLTFSYLCWETLT